MTMLNWRRRLEILLGRGEQPPPGQAASTGHAGPDNQNSAGHAPDRTEMVAAKMLDDSSVAPHDGGSSQSPRPKRGEDARADSVASDETLTVEEKIEFDEEWYLEQYPGVARAVKEGRFISGLGHYLMYGRQEGRLTVPPVGWVRTSAQKRDSEP